MRKKKKDTWEIGKREFYPFAELEKKLRRKK